MLLAVFERTSAKREPPSVHRTEADMLDPRRMDSHLGDTESPGAEPWGFIGIAGFLSSACEAGRVKTR